MSNNFDLSVTNQSEIFFTDVVINASDKLIKFSQNHTNVARFIGLPIGLCHSLLTLAESVTNIGESVIKGIANVFGSPFSKKCSFTKGVKQLFIQSPLKLVDKSFQSITTIALSMLNLPIQMLIFPTGMLEIINGSNAMLKDFLIDLTNPYKNLPEEAPRHLKAYKEILELKYT